MTAGTSICTVGVLFCVVVFDTHSSKCTLLVSYQTLWKMATLSSRMAATKHRSIAVASASARDRGCVDLHVVLLFVVFDVQFSD